MSDLGPPEMLAEKYRLVRKLGQGGMGSVWYADHLALKSPVAIKIVDPQIANHPDALARFLREAQSAASLRSPHVVQIFDYGVDQGVPYIVMELLEGESLAARLARVGRLSPAETAEVMTHVGRAVTRAHEANVTHRDLKPDNIFLVRNEEEQIAKVLDFGIAKTSNGLDAAVGSVTRTGAVLGTPYYMSPEQATGAKSLDHRTDIWAMGVIAFECLLGQRPFAGDTLATIFIGICTASLPIPSSFGPVPPAFDAWFARACARDLGERFATAKEATLALRRACSGEAATGRASLASSEDARWTQMPSTIANSDLYGSRLRSPASVSSATASILMQSKPPRARVGPRLLIGAAVGALLVLAATVALMNAPGPSVTKAAEVSAVAPAASAIAATAEPPTAGPAKVEAPKPVDPPPEIPSRPEPTSRLSPDPVPSRVAPATPVVPRTKPRAARPSANPAPQPAAPTADPVNPKVNLGI